MKIFLHTLYTWAIAGVVCSVIVNFRFAGFPDSFFHMIGRIAWVSAGILFISLPALLISALILSAITKSGYSPLEKLFLWGISVFGAVTLNASPLIFIVGFPIEAESLVFEFWPPYAAGIIAIVIRYRQFLLLINNERVNQPSDVFE